MGKKVLFSVLKNAGWRLIDIAAYCIMDNHVHIVHKVSLTQIKQI
jgi:REP element-mobilizing transposase RayT